MVWRLWAALAFVLVVGGCNVAPGIDKDAGPVGGSGGARSGLGGSGGAGAGGGEGGSACVPVDDHEPCTDDVCENGVPAHKPTAVGTPCSMSATQCDGMGSCVGCVDPEDCPGIDDACQSRTCVQGKCGKALAATDAPCDDGNACTQTDTCQGGFCVGADTVTCAALDPCHLAGACDPATGACSNPAMLCTGGTSCVAGACRCTGVIGRPGPPQTKVASNPGAVAAMDLNCEGKPDLARAG